MAWRVEIVHKRLTIGVKKFIDFDACAFDSTYQPVRFTCALAL